MFQRLLQVRIESFERVPAFLRIACGVEYVQLLRLRAREEKLIDETAAYREAQSTGCRYEVSFFRLKLDGKGSEGRYLFAPVTRMVTVISDLESGSRGRTSIDVVISLELLDVRLDGLGVRSPTKSDHFSPSLHRSASWAMQERSGLMLDLLSSKDDEGLPKRSHSHNRAGV